MSVDVKHFASSGAGVKNDLKKKKSIDNNKIRKKNCTLNKNKINRVVPFI